MLRAYIKNWFGKEKREMQELLPLGSVVVLKEGTKKLMIIGRLQANPKTKNLYDYAGCPWPEGYMDKEHCYVFNHDDIDLLYYLGMQDIEEFNFRFKLDEAIEKIESEGYKHAKRKCIDESKD